MLSEKMIDAALDAYNEFPCPKNGSIGRCCDEGQMRATLEAALRAQDDAQPVAWLHRQGDHTEASERRLDDDEISRGWTQEPLYLHPAPEAAQALSEDVQTRVLKLLQELEWDGWYYARNGDGTPCCSVCGNDKHEGGDREHGHAPDCEMAALLAILTRASAATVAEPSETDRAVRCLSRESSEKVKAVYATWAHENGHRAKTLADRIIDDYLLHYDFPTQGQSHMQDCIVSVLSAALTEAPQAAQQQVEPGKFSVSKEWLAERLERADDADCAAGQSQSKRPCDAPPGCNATNCLGCGEQQAEPVGDERSAVDPMTQALPFAIVADEMKALRRFHECATDDEGYDVPKDMMKRLSEIGLVRRVTSNIYEHTDFGLALLNGDFAAQSAQITEAPDLLSPMGIRNDRDMLNYLHQAFESEMSVCPRCHHSEPTSGTDSASFLRQYLTAAPTPAAQGGDGE